MNSNFIGNFQSAQQAGDAAFNFFDENPDVEVVKAAAAGRMYEYKVVPNGIVGKPMPMPAVMM